MEAKREVKKVMREVEEESLTLVLTPDEVRQLRLLAGGLDRAPAQKAMLDSFACTRPLSERDAALTGVLTVGRFLVNLMEVTTTLGGEVA